LKTAHFQHCQKERVPVSAIASDTLTTEFNEQHRLALPKQGASFDVASLTRINQMIQGGKLSESNKTLNFQFGNFISIDK
jgi:hypothetical protein